MNISELEDLMKCYTNCTNEEQFNYCKQLFENIFKSDNFPNIFLDVISNSNNTSLISLFMINFRNGSANKTQMTDEIIHSLLEKTVEKIIDGTFQSNNYGIVFRFLSDIAVCDDFVLNNFFQFLNSFGDDNDKKLNFIYNLQSVVLELMIYEDINNSIVSRIAKEFSDLFKTDIFTNYIYKLIENSNPSPVWVKICENFLDKFCVIDGFENLFLEKVNLCFNFPQCIPSLIDLLNNYQSTNYSMLSQEEMHIVQKFIEVMLVNALNMLINELKMPNSDECVVQQASSIYLSVIDFGFDFFGLEQIISFTTNEIFKCVYIFLDYLIQFSEEEFITVLEMLCQCLSYFPNDIIDIQVFKKFVFDCFQYMINIVDTRLSPLILEKIRSCFACFQEDPQYIRIISEFIYNIIMNNNITSGVYLAIAYSDKQICQRYANTFAVAEIPPNSVTVLLFIAKCCNFAADVALNLVIYTLSYNLIEQFDFKYLGKALNSLSYYYPNILANNDFFTPLCNLISSEQDDQPFRYLMIVLLRLIQVKEIQTEDLISLLNNFKEMLSQRLNNIQINNIDNFKSFLKYANKFINGTNYKNPNVKEIMVSFYNSIFEVIFNRCIPFLQYCEQIDDDDEKFYIHDLICQMLIKAKAKQWIKNKRNLFNFAIEHISSNIDDKFFINPFFSIIASLPEFFPDEKLCEIFENITQTQFQKLFMDENYDIEPFPFRYCYILTNVYTTKSFENVGFCYQYIISKLFLHIKQSIDNNSIILMILWVISRNYNCFQQTIKHIFNQYTNFSSNKLLPETLIQEFKSHFKLETNFEELEIIFTKILLEFKKNN